MSRLDFEKARRYTLRSDYANDDLPPTGSWSDRKRYLHQTYDSSQPPQRQTPYAAGRVQTMAHSLRADLVRLEKYVSHAERADFSRKPQVQKDDVISIIKRLLLRDSFKSIKPNTSDGQLLERARRIVRQYSH